MTSLLPEIQVGPLGGIFLYILIALVAVGLIFSVSLGGALVWALIWIAILALAYIFIVRVGGVLFGGRGL